ncbi:distal tail protein Dit [Halobacillus sp. A5]|uniref:distal tail protein Dit n=1 Tax=Halobacillus sp. A5 TaxID=2880263 RepID=UPI0020A63794|nr:distal tail protein Dit [Halobacillus sp. A5]MCP3025993.1 phage tail family protein [Halobacillus sp. A5]
MASEIKSYAGVETPSFLIIEKVTPQTLPPARVNSMNIPMKNGERFINKTLGVRTFVADVAIKVPKGKTLLEMMDDLADWLDYDEPQKFILRDKPNIYYMAIVESSTDIQRFSYSGKGQITFVCYDPHGYGDDKQYVYEGNQEDPTTIVNNEGNKETAPIMSMRFVKDVTDFAVTTDDDMLYFGEPFDPDVNTIKDFNPKLVYEEMDSFDGWTNGVSVDGGNIVGEFETNNRSFRQSGKDYGEGTKWHGASMIKSVGKEIQDFTIDMHFGMDSYDAKEKGRVELYLLDVNGNKIGKIALVDLSASGIFPKFEARAGSFQDGHYFANDYGKRKDTYKNFYGKMVISRKGKKWNAYIAHFNTDTRKFEKKLVKSWTDTLNQYDATLASVQVHIATYNDDAIYQDMYIYRVTVWEHITFEEEDIDFVFRVDDDLIIDNDKGEIYLNGEEFYDRLYHSSTFLMLDKGLNGIAVSDTDAITDCIINFKERWK